MSYSAMPPGGPPRRGAPGSTGPAPKGKPLADSTWPLPRDAVATDTQPPTGKRPRKEVPAPSGAAQAQPPPLRGLRSEKTNAGAAGRMPDTTTEEIPILPPAGLNIGQRKKSDKVPPPIATKAQPEQTVPSFSFPKPSAPNTNAPNFQEPPAIKPLRTGPPGSAPARAAASQQPPVPEPLRPGPQGTAPPRSGQAIPNALRPGMSRSGQGPDLLPEQPGPAPSGPVPTPSKSPGRAVNNLPGDQGLPPPLRFGKQPPNPQQNGGAGSAVPPRNPTDSSAAQKGAPPAALDASKARSGFGSPPGAAGPFARKPVNQNPLGSSPPRPSMQTIPLAGAFAPGTNPLRQQPPQQQGNAASTNPFRPSAPNQPLQPGNQPNLNPSVYRPSTATSPPPRGQTAANFAPPATRPLRQAPPPGPPPRVTSPPAFSGARPGATYPGPSHAPSNSLDSNVSNDSTASSSTATSTRPLNPSQQRQNTAFSNKPTTLQSSSDPREKGAPGGGGYYTGNPGGVESGAAQTPYMNMLLSLDRIPRMHNILVSFFVWILLAGFVIIPGSFTSGARKQDNETIQLPISTGTAPDAEKLALTPANTAAMVIGFVCIVAGMFGSAWLALRWRRNYVWLLNKLYLPLILNALAGLIATVTSVYTQQAGEWRPQAVTTAVVEAVVLVVSGVLFFVYNYWLLQRVRSDHEEVVMGGGREKKERKKGKKKRRGFLLRFKKARSKPPYAAGSVV